MAIRCGYTDLDGTLLGSGGAALRDAGGAFALLGAGAREAGAGGGPGVVPVSGRRRPPTAEIARLLGQTAYAFELGCGVVVDGEETLLTGHVQPRDEMTVYELIRESGAPALLLERYAGRLEYHAPWHDQREFTHLLRGLVHVEEADALLGANGHDDLRLVDNGAIAPKPSLPDLEAAPHAYHLMPGSASKAAAVEVHMRARGLFASDCIAEGDSREDVGIAPLVGRFFLVANGAEKDPSLAAGTNVEVTEGRNGEGFYEAVVRSLAEARAA